MTKLERDLTRQLKEKSHALGEMTRRYRMERTRRKQMENLFKPGTWVQYLSRATLIMSDAEAIFLMHLLNHYQVHAKKNKFFWRMKSIRKTIGYSVDKQTRIVNKLKKRGYITTKQKLGHVRYFKVNWPLVLGNMASKDFV